MTNLDLIKGLYSSFSVGDIPAVLEALDEDVDWTEAEGFPYGGTYFGRDAVLANVFMKLGTEWDGFGALPSKYVSEGDTVVVLGTYVGTHKATGRSISVPMVHVWTIGDGKVLRFVQHTDTLVVSRAL